MSHDRSLFDIVSDAGLETLFNLDVLRQSYDPKTEHPLLEHLRKLLLIERDNTLIILPKLCANYIISIKKHRGALFGQGSQSQPEAALAEFHEAGLRFFILLLSLVNYTHRDTLTWKTRLSLLQIVDQENLFDRHQVEAQMTFNQIIDLIIVALNDAWKGEQYRYYLVTTLIPNAQKVILNALVLPSNVLRQLRSSIMT